MQQTGNTAIILSFVEIIPYDSKENVVQYNIVGSTISFMDRCIPEKGFCVFKDNDNSILLPVVYCR